MATQKALARTAFTETRTQFFSTWSQTGAAMAIGGLIVILGWAVTVAESTRDQPPLTLLYCVLGFGMVLFLAGAYVFWAAMTERKLPGHTSYELAEMQGDAATKMLSRFQRTGHTLAISENLTVEQSSDFFMNLMGFIDDVWGEHEADSLLPTRTFGTPQEAMSSLLEDLKNLARRSTSIPLKSTFNGPSKGVNNWVAYINSEESDGPTP